MKATKKQRQQLDKTFQALIIELHQDLILFKNNLVNNTLVNADIKFDHDYEQFGREAFFHKLEMLVAGEKILEETRKLTNNKYQ